MIKEKIQELNTKDVYSLVLFALYKLKDVPEYQTLSELSFILDKDNLTNFFEYYGGMTIKVPTLDEFKITVSALLLYEFVNLEGIEFDQAVKMLDVKEFKIKDIKETYYSLCGILDTYEFKR